MNLNPRNRTILSSCLLGIVVIALVWVWLPGKGRKAAGLAESDEPADRLKAVELVRGEGGDDVREILTRLAEDKDPKVALAAIEALGASDDDSFRQPLEALLSRSSRPRIRARAAASLGRHKSSSTDQLIELMATDKSALVRAGAAEGLSHKRDQAAVEAILKAMDDDKLAVRRAARTALHRTVGVHFLYRPDDPQARRRASIRQIRRLLGQMESEEHR